MASKAQQQLFISQICPIITREAKSRGYHVVSAILAQACVESAYGTCALSKHHNYFGMKCGSSWKGMCVDTATHEEYTPGVLTSIKDKFRAYTDMEAGVKGYFDFINTKRYIALKYCTTPEQYILALKAAGYATSSKYVNTLMNVVNTLGLRKYDDFSAVAFTPKVGGTYTTAVRVNLRDAAKGAQISRNDTRVTASCRNQSTEDAKGYCVLNSGVRVTLLEIVDTPDGNKWARIPSGWICIKCADKWYIR